MNEETPQQTPAEAPAEESQTNTNPNSAPEKKSKKKLVLIIVAVVILLGGAAFAWNAMRKPTTQPEVKTTTEEVIETEPETKVAADPYAGWATFTGTCSGASFKYASDWKVTYSEKNPDLIKCQAAMVTSPTGNILTWVPYYYGDGGSCLYMGEDGKTNECDTVKTLSAESLNKSGELADIYLMKQIVCNTAGKCEGRIVLSKKVEAGSAKQDPRAVFGSRAFYMTQGKSDTYANPPGTKLEFTEASAKEWLNSTDVNNTVLSMKSLTIK